MKMTKVPSRHDPQFRLPLPPPHQWKWGCSLLLWLLCCWAEDVQQTRDRLVRTLCNTGVHGDTFSNDPGVARGQYDLCVLLGEFQIDKGAPMSAQQGTETPGKGDVLLHDDFHPLVGQLHHSLVGWLRL